MSGCLPNIIIHGFEEELVVGSVQLSFEVSQCHLARTLTDLHQVGSFLVVHIVYDLSFFHG